MDPFDAWAAGFFDGEGYVGIAVASNGTHRLDVIVTQVDRRPLDALAERWGGTVRMRRSTRARQRDSFVWQRHGSHAVAFLRDVRPLLLVKAEVVDLALQFGATILTRHGGRRLAAVETIERQRIRGEILARNRRGVA